MKKYYNFASFTREHFDNLMLEMGYRYGVPEIELLNFYGAKKIRAFKQSHKSLFAEILRR